QRSNLKRYHDETHDQRKTHLFAFIKAYNFAKRLKTLKGLTPYEFMIKMWQNEPEKFIMDPHHHSLGLNRRF
ncbi:MAG: IS481 family transposase, partial [Alphaproteobacteria bacterium]